MTKQEIKKASRNLMLELEERCECFNRAHDSEPALVLEKSIHYGKTGQYFEAVTVSAYSGNVQEFCEFMFIASYTKEEDVKKFLEKISNKLKL